VDPVAASVIRDNCEGTQFELPALCIAKWRLRKFLLHNRRRSTLGQAKQNKSPVEQEQGIVVRGGPANFAGTAHNEATQQTNPSPSVDKKSGLGIRVFG